MANTFDDTQPKLLIIIPAYNEAENIERVVDNLTENYPQWDYLVVNDGSKDWTAEICREKGYPLLDLPVNLGLAGEDGGGKVGYCDWFPLLRGEKAPHPADAGQYADHLGDPAHHRAEGVRPHLRYATVQLERTEKFLQQH